MKSIGERIYPGSCNTTDDFVLYLKHLFAYEYTRGVLNNSSRVLEVGCGEGYGTSVLSQGVGEITGLDLEQKVIDAANQSYGSHNCRYKVFDGSHIPFSDGEFDAVVSFQVIEHVPDDVSFLAEISRVLKPGGVLFLATPTRDYRLRIGQKPWNPFHLREYSADQFSAVVGSVFNSFKLHGVCAVPKVQKIETNRVYANRFISPFRQIIRFWDKTKHLFGAEEEIPLQSAKVQFSTKDFFLVESSIEKSLDLFAICTK